ncbi:MAG TPA: alpha/beta hydrolase [Gemmatimonadales bacterium]
MTVRLVAGPAGALCVDDGGDGAPAVLFVHSLAGRADHWSAALEHCRPQRRAVAFDQRGHGRSAPLDDRAEVDIETLADDVRVVADACGLRRFALVGHSLGGGVALAFAGAYPDRVERLLLLDPIGDGTQMPAAQVQPFLDRLDSPAYVPAIESYWGTISGPDVAVRERLLADLRATPPATVVAGFRASLRFDPTTALLRYRGPALAVVTPANDAPFSLHRVGRLPHRVVEGTGHWIQLDRPAEFARLLDGFLEAPA